ncbi:unnamed protein product [Musa acuminata subsp. burmannicoides]
MEAEGVEMNTLHHVDDLPFELEHMPTNYGGFREKVKGVAVRKTIETPEEVKGLRRGILIPGRSQGCKTSGLIRHQPFCRMANLPQVLLLRVVRLKHWSDRRNLLLNVVPNHIK